MHVRETQRLGALTILIASIAVYGGSLLKAHYPNPEISLPWANQGPGMVAMEIAGSTGADGVYFVPERTSLATILKAIGIAGEIEPAGADYTAGSAYTVSVDGSGLKIGDMPATRRIALGLPIDLNRASEEDLALVPGIGDRLAAQIVQLRQTRRKFESVSDLAAVRGIKEKKLRSLMKYLMVRPVP